MKWLVGCEFSGRIRDALIKLGHDAMSCDLLPSETKGPHYIGSVFDVMDFPWDGAIIHIPCTHTAVSGAHRFKEKQMDGRQQAAVAMFMRAWRGLAHVPRVAFEHPMSVISTLFRKPDQIIQPWQFGHGEVKATGWWLRNLPPLRPTRIVRGRQARVHRANPGKDRWKERSRTLPGIADAVAKQWGAINW